MNATTPESVNPIPAPVDAAESHWDPWMLALYLRELAEKRRPTVH